MILEIWSDPVEKLFSERKNGNKKFGDNFGCPQVKLSTVQILMANKQISFDL